MICVDESEELDEGHEGDAQEDPDQGTHHQGEGSRGAVQSAVSEVDVVVAVQLEEVQREGAHHHDVDSVAGKDLQAGREEMEVRPGLGAEDNAGQSANSRQEDVKEEENQQDSKQVGFVEVPSKMERALVGCPVFLDQLA